VRAVFLDRDGVINENRVDHVKSWGEFRFLPRAPEAIARLTRAGHPVFIITNQAIVNRGLVSCDIVEGINRRMIRELEWQGGRVVDVAYCPHRPDERCGCRKPKPGLLLQLAHRHGVNLQDAVLIGDARSDLEAGHAVGCETMLVLTGRGTTQLPLVLNSPPGRVTVALDLEHAVDLVLSRRGVAMDVGSHADTGVSTPQAEFGLVGGSL
jgi:D-glycero-D-manno-heptose 1,7-bisphosphate phosphatase